EIGGCNIDPASKCRPVGEKALQYGAVFSAEHLHVRAATSARSGNDIVETIAVDIAPGHEYPACECGIVGEETADFHSAHPVKHLHVRPATRTSAGDNIGHTVPRNVSRRYPDAATKTRTVREEAELLDVSLSVEDLDMRSAAGIRACHDNVVWNH